LQGTFDGTTNAQNNLSATFTLPNGLGQWSATLCTATFPQPAMGIAAGRVWTTVDCPAATNAETATTCEGTATVRFENCAQE